MTTSLKILLPYYTASCLLLIAFGLFKLLYFLPFAHSLIEVMISKLSTIDMKKEDYWKGLFGWKMYSTYQKVVLRELQREAYLNRQTPNPLLTSVDGNTTHRLLDMARGSRPLVVNFGSCTCPVFMERLQQFGEIVEEFSPIADFLTVYIEEAHPTDEWKLKNTPEIPQHKTQEERCSAAQLLLSLRKLNSPLLLDSIDDNASKAFAATPIRLFIIQDKIVRYIGGVGPTFYNIQDVKKWLENNVHKDLNNNDSLDGKCP
ncbi:type I iodothyronine deiodinase-like [Actinia tenebrosa]|uniref:Iodothyronine deiodinase n=1 Tax=Actinia tenebrosa TaxID=6105 RepID=A0A6P8J6P1_ACTTE|nr:type I iodothyronine deiodinase-like [Actinia tenebrosa]